MNAIAQASLYYSQGRQRQTADRTKAHVVDVHPSAHWPNLADDQPRESGLIQHILNASHVTCAHGM